jgi:hypothetical protein
MATILRNSETCFDKGDYGELLFRDILEKKDYTVYTPKTKGAHPFDIIAVHKCHKTGEKKPVFAADVKTKPMRVFYSDTGISLNHYYTYLKFSKTHLMEFWLIFVDQNLGKIYGNTISKLDIPIVINSRAYPLNEGKTRYWPIESMLPIRLLTGDEIEELDRLSQINDKYKKQKNRMTQPKFEGF